MLHSAKSMCSRLGALRGCDPHVHCTFNGFKQRVNLSRLCRRLSTHSKAVAQESATQQAAVEQEASSSSFKAQLDFKYIKDNLDAVVLNCQNRQSKADPRAVVQLYDQFLQLKQVGPSAAPASWSSSYF